MHSVVSFRSVVALIDRFPVLAGVDLDVDAGEIVGVTGPNGAGKTSLLRTIAGLVSIERGEATVLGMDITADRRSIRRSIGYVPQEPALYGDLTVAENVGFFVRAAGASTDGIHSAMRMVGVDGNLAQLTVDRLSSGQRRRVGLAVLLARDPQLWLLDEPHASLDGTARETLDALICSASQRGRTVIFSSHETERVEALAQRSVCVNGGVIDPKSTDITNPKTAQVANVS